MPLAEPDFYSLWRAVESAVDWPTADEDRTVELGRAWSDLGAVFRAAARNIEDLPAGAWTDQAGQMYADRITALRTSASGVGDRMARLGALADAYGNDVRYAKNAIILYVAELDEEYRAQPQVVAPIVANEINNLLDNIEGRIRARATGTEEPPRWELRGLDELTAPPAPTVTLPRPYGPGNPGPGGSLEGRTEYAFKDPATGQFISDVDRIEGGVLWEDKTAPGAQDAKAWAQSQVYDKLQKYVRGQAVSKELAEYREAPIGLRLDAPIDIEPELRDAVEEVIARFQRENPDVDVRVEYV